MDSAAHASTSTPQLPPLKVLIVGGGIAGLTLANALEKMPMRVDYLVLEGRSHLAPQLGAGLAMLPSGSRILDQLGIYADLESAMAPVVNSGVIDARGYSLLKERTDTAQLVGARMSYPFAWVERRNLVKALARGLVRRGSVLTRKKVCAVEQSEAKGVTVSCTDGSAYVGDIVVGADGVHSKVRSEMWRYMEQHDDGTSDILKERRAMTAEYKCLFGISKPIPGFKEGESDDTMGHDVSVVLSCGEGGKIFWFLFARLDRVYQAHEIPRFNAADALEFAQKHANFPIKPGGTITLSDLWDAREVTTLSVLEEADFKHWTTSRIICIGDSVHKMTPHTGTGGMLAIESAAELANALHCLARSHGESPPTFSQIEKTLVQVEMIMHTRTTENIKATADVTRFHALRDMKHRILAPYLVPYSGDGRVDQVCDVSVGASHINFLPLPPRSMDGFMPFNPNQGIGKEEKKWVRVILASPMLILAMTIGGQAVFVLSPQESNILSRSLPFLVDYSVWNAILLIESGRRAHRLSVLRFALIWGLLNTQYPAAFMPLYCFAHYILNPVAVFGAADMRLTDISYTRTILPLTLIFQITAFIASCLPPASRHNALGYLWVLFPLVTCLAQEFLYRYILPASTLEQDRLKSVKRDLPTIRRTLLLLCLVSVVSWQYTIWTTGLQIADAIHPASSRLGFRAVLPSTTPNTPWCTHTKSTTLPPHYTGPVRCFVSHHTMRASCVYTVCLCSGFGGFGVVYVGHWILKIYC